jgi:hypothetical protein
VRELKTKLGSARKCNNSGTFTHSFLFNSEVTRYTVKYWKKIYVSFLCEVFISDTIHPDTHSASYPCGKFQVAKETLVGLHVKVPTTVQDSSFLRYYAMPTNKQLPTFCRNTVPLASGSNNTRRKSSQKSLCWAPLQQHENEGWLYFERSWKPLI